MDLRVLDQVRDHNRFQPGDGPFYRSILDNNGYLNKVPRVNTLETIFLEYQRANPDELHVKTVLTRQMKPRKLFSCGDQNDAATYHSTSSIRVSSSRHCLIVNNHYHLTTIFHPTLSFPHLLFR